MVDVVKSTPLIARTIIKNIESTELDAHANPAVYKNVFNVFFSLDLLARIIEKKIIDKNIRNSTIISIINKAINKATENSPIIIVDNKSFKVSKNVGEINIISRDTTMVIKPSKVSISAVIYFELRIWFLVTGSVWVRYASSLYKDLEKFIKLLKNG